ncbi:MAG: flagellar hook-associated protein FlgL [Betaproteobacteria bacterium]|nr:flagellar hook-associated protein FlgL [Betaproteobacteria bacterium]MBP6188283.1 flagellar hook-associated protein FlgL [Azonexus sp.]MBP6202572.1 flagellar hook-associated protein FlgL [Azonexus sp.]
MRISTSMMFDTGTQNMLQLQTGLYKLQNQLSTGRRILSPADDPVAAAQALVISQRQSINTQFIDNQGNAESQLASLESRLAGVSDLIQAVKTRAVEAGNGAYSDSDRRTISAEIRERFDELVGLANSSDAMGNYVFSGFRGDTQPFSTTGAAGSRTTAYDGDDGKRQLQVETGRFMDVTESGRDVFMKIPQGNGQFMFTADSANTGTGVVGASSLITGYNDSSYQLKFNANSTYDLTVTTNGVPTVTAGVAYTSGADITLGPVGQQFKISISGTPATNDTFEIEPATNQDIFKTLDNMIKALEGNVSSSAANRAAFQNQMTSIGENLDQALDHILSKQTSIGARRIELQSLTDVAADLNIQYRQDISKLQDLDYTEAISDLTNQKMVLEAAQLSFKQVSQMSLFNYL